jgi:hypothetical protein
MARPTLQNGDLWDDSLANASGFPQLDGADEFGSGPKVIDNWLSDAAGQIKANFYGWYNRIQATPGPGLTLAWTGAEVVLGNGSIAAINPGNVTLAANASGFLVISEAGTVQSLVELPSICVPLAAWATNGTGVVSLTDLRQQRRDRVGPVRVSQGPTIDVGDIKMTGRASPSAGFLRCHGQRYNASEFPLLFAAIGTANNLPGDPVNTFRVPDLRRRSPLGADPATGLDLGQRGGAAAVSLTTAQLPTHSHGVNDPGHGHPVNDPGHNHGVNDPGHLHSMAPFRPYSEGSGRRGFGAELTNIPFPGISPVSTQPSVTGVNLNPSASGVSVGGAGTNIQIRPEGSGAAVPTQSPFVAVHFDIRAF